MNNQVFAGQLYEVLGTPVSTKILDVLSEKQIGLLGYQYSLARHAMKMKKDFGGGFDLDIKEAIDTIKSILDFGKKKLPQKAYREQTNFYLNTKYPKI